MEHRLIEGEFTAKAQRRTPLDKIQKWTVSFLIGLLIAATIRAAPQWPAV